MKREERFTRQTRLWGDAAQRQLGQARVLVVGCGGLGAPVIQYLAAAGVGGIDLVDDDVVEASNLNRQVLFKVSDLGALKVERAAAWIRDFDPEMEVVAHDVRASVNNARELVRGKGLVVDATDGMPSKYLLNDACVREGVPLMHGAASAFAGQLMLIDQRPSVAGAREQRPSVAGAGERQPCLRCLFPKIPGPGVVPTCAEVGALGAVIGVVGALMAQESLKYLAGQPSMRGKFASWDAQALRLEVLPVPPNDECPACSDGASLDARRLEDYLP